MTPLFYLSKTLLTDAFAHMFLVVYGTAITVIAQENSV